MPECPVCRREFDSRFQVFAAPSRDSYDTVDCARRAARSDGGAQAILAPTVLPTIELLPLARSMAAAPPATLIATSRRRLAAAFAIPLVASPAAVAAGLSLVAVGTATSLALWSPSLDGNGPSVITAAASGTTSPSSEVAPPDLSSEQGDTGKGMQRAESGAPAAAQSASDGEELITFVESGELPQIGGDSDLGIEEPSSEVSSSAAPSLTPPHPETTPRRPPGPASEGKPVMPAAPKTPVWPAAPKTPVGPLSPPWPGTPPSSPESEAPPPPPEVRPPPPRAPEESSPTPKPKPRTKHVDKEKHGATPAVPAVPANGKTRRDEPKPRSSPPATPAIPAVPPSRGKGEPQPETGAGGPTEASGTDEPGGGNGNEKEKGDNGQGKGNGRP